MDVSFSWDLPPVPDCFSKLLINENDRSPIPNQPWREAERLRELKDVMLKCLAEDSVPETEGMVNGDGIHLMENGCVGGEGQRAHPGGGGEGRVGGGDVDVLPQSPPSGDSASALCRLNTALSRLRQEMVGIDDGSHSCILQYDKLEYTVCYCA